MSEKKTYQLVCSYVKNEVFVSTIYRRASTPEEIWYFETIAWEWDSETKNRGKMLEMVESGISENQALSIHFEVVEQFKPKTNE